MFFLCNVIFYIRIFFIKKLITEIVYIVKLCLIQYFLKSTLYKVNYNVVRTIIEIGTHQFQHVQCNFLIVKIFLITLTYLIT